MALAILGAGSVGLALGQAFSRIGEAVVFGVRDPAKVADAVAALGPGLAGLSIGTTSSGAEQLAALALGARVVKAFNTTGAENMAEASYPGSRIFLPVCGDDPGANARVVQLARAIGFEAVAIGLLAAARYLEPFAMTWIHMAIKQGMGRNFAFGLLRRDAAGP